MTIDFYTKVHKGLRAALFALSERAATTDYEAAECLPALMRELSEALGKLSAHAAHEARFIHPLLQEKLGATFDEEHAALENLQDGLIGELATVAQAAHGERRTRGLVFYRGLNRFIARYLEHLEREEAAMPLLREKCTDEELSGVLARFGASRTPGEAAGDLAWMLPALSPAERDELVRPLISRHAA
jgi:hypothetical protein